MIRRITILSVGFFVVAAAAGCTNEPPPKSPPPKQEGVPANSLSDARMNGEEDPKDREKRAAAQTDHNDPTQPYTTKVGDAPSDPGSSASSSASGKGGAKGNGKADPTSAPPASGGKGAVSKSECDRVMDKYIELEIARNPELKGVPPEVIDQAKQMAREKHGEAPCTATRAQYTCAMGATTTAAWQKCMK